MEPGVVDFEIPNLEDADFTSSTSLVSVLVGDDMVDFKVPSAQLCFWSPFFKAACSAKWQSVDESGDEFEDDSDECIVELPEHKPVSFKAFVIWMHTGAFGNIIFSAEVEEPEPEPNPTDNVIWRLKWLALAECWILGDYLQVNRFCNAVMDQMIPMLQDCFTQARVACCSYKATVDYVYSHTMDKDSPLRLVVVDTSIARVNRQRLVGSISSATTNKEYQSEILNAMVIQARQGERAPDPWSVYVHRCRYHNHKNEAADYKCPFARP
jgi:hypothetical protein